MDTFFSRNNCDRCGASLEGGRIMSMYNTDCICMECKKRERLRKDYKAASDAENEAVKAGNLSFKGIGFKEESL